MNTLGERLKYARKKNGYNKDYHAEIIGFYIVVKKNQKKNKN